MLTRDLAQELLNTNKKIEGHDMRLADIEAKLIDISNRLISLLNILEDGDE
jgi:hypothetical protein